MTINSIADDIAILLLKVRKFINEKNKSGSDYDEFATQLCWDLHFIQTKAEFLNKDLEYLKESIIHKFSIVGIE